MKLTFLGTSAGEGYPAIWCDCPNCRYAREKGGKNLRANSMAVLDDDVLLDMNANCFAAAQKMGLDLRSVTTLLVTHEHQDHFFPQHLVWRGNPRVPEGMLEITAPVDDISAYQGATGSRFSPLPLLTICGSAAIGAAIDAHPRLALSQMDRFRARFVELSGGQRMEANGLRATAVVSRHGTPGMTNNYIVERDGKTLLYALDTSGYDEDMLRLLGQYHYDCVVMEGTFGHHALDLDTHMNTRKNLRMLAFFTQNGLWKDRPNLVLSHMSPHWTPPHDLYVEEMARHGVTVAYDGLVLEI